MKRWIKAFLLPTIALAPAVTQANEVVEDEKPVFSPAVQWTAGGQPVVAGSPGYASPCYADVDGDGKKDLLVGQFAGGKIKFYKNEGDGKFAKGQWLEAEGETVTVPGVW